MTQKDLSPLALPVRRRRAVEDMETSGTPGKWYKYFPSYFKMLRYFLL